MVLVLERLLDLLAPLDGDLGGVLLGIQGHGRRVERPAGVARLADLRVGEGPEAAEATGARRAGRGVGQDQVQISQRCRRPSAGRSSFRQSSLTWYNSMLFL